MLIIKLLSSSNQSWAESLLSKAGLTAGPRWRDNNIYLSNASHSGIEILYRRQSGIKIKFPFSHIVLVSFITIIYDSVCHRDAKHF